MAKLYGRKIIKLCIGQGEGNSPEECLVLNEEDLASLKSEIARDIIAEFAELSTQYVKDKGLLLVTFKNALDYAGLILRQKYLATVHCKDCQHLMYSDCYGECSKGHKGIVNPNDTCVYGVKKSKES